MSSEIWHQKKLRGLNTLGWFSAILHKGDNFYGFLLAFLANQAAFILKKGSFSKERIRPHWAQNSGPDQGLQCLPVSQQFLENQKVKKWDSNLRKSMVMCWGVRIF